MGHSWIGSWIGRWVGRWVGAVLGEAVSRRETITFAVTVPGRTFGHLVVMPGPEVVAVEVPGAVLLHVGIESDATATVDLRTVVSAAVELEVTA